MAEVTIYTKSWCPFCVRAKNLLDAKRVSYTEIDVDAEPGLEREMIRLSDGRRTVPQIFIDGRGVGGYDDIAALDAQGRLDPLLRAEDAREERR